MNKVYIKSVIENAKAELEHHGSLEGSAKGLLEVVDYLMNKNKEVDNV